MDQHLVRLPVYLPELGDHVRLLVQYGGEWRPFFWISVRKDGSVYLGPRYETIATLMQGSKRAEGGQLTILYGEGQVVTDPELMKRSKLSFHGSGIVGAAGDRWTRLTPLRDLKAQESLCSVVFQHPSSFAPAPAVRKRDICLEYAVDEERPLQVHVHVAPSGQETFRLVGGATAQHNLVLHYPSIQRSVQIALFHGPEFQWPPFTIIYWLVAPPESSPEPAAPLAPAQPPA